MASAISLLVWIIIQTLQMCPQLWIFPWKDTRASPTLRPFRHFFLGVHILGVQPLQPYYCFHTTLHTLLANPVHPFFTSLYVILSLLLLYKIVLDHLVLHSNLGSLPVVFCFAWCSWWTTPHSTGALGVPQWGWHYVSKVETKCLIFFLIGLLSLELAHVVIT